MAQLQLSDSLIFLPFLPSSSPFTILAIFLFFICFVLLHPGGLAWAISLITTPSSSSSIPGPCFSLSNTLSSPLAHRILASLSKSLHATGLMSFSVGLTRFIISSKPDTAKEILTSANFANRPVKETAYELLFHRAMGFAPYGEYWRTLRRIAASHMFGPRGIAASLSHRQVIVDRIICQVRQSMEKNGEVLFKEILHYGSLNCVMMSVFGRMYEYGKGGEGDELESMVREGYELLSVFNWSDHVPFLGWLDLQGVRRRCRSLVTRVDAFVGRIVGEHKASRKLQGNGDARDGDFVDVLLGLQEEEKLSDSDMVAVLWEMIFRGTDTVAILLEWIFARMVLHPDIQSKVQLEISSVTGPHRSVSDSDIPHLPYLQSVVKEALRMHPPGPLLSWARLAIEDCHIGPHFVPAGTTAMVNMWAITHDESIWPEADVFKPERFMDQDVSIMGSDLRLAPFGSGRRVCPGKALGLATVHLWLARLLESFTWVPSEAGVDLSECLKMSMEMERPLVCKAVPRYVM
ncbi:Cytochrome P450 [Rhynchospora pubera]|uniref:Cytochrome P450 n=1 Tax=Rhynchospora pubera TaxID=906938 RepID=A0AAV8CKV5_9POAL|nr:Cytochrome P450 [Rhynchospora pubera]